MPMSLVSSLLSQLTLACAHHYSILVSREAQKSHWEAATVSQVSRDEHTVFVSGVATN